MKARELIALLISVCGCTQNIGEKYPTNNENVDFSYEIITEEEALETLFDFMDRTDIMTRSESKRAIKSVDKYPLMTKTDSDPEAYIINFVDYKGFAVLGARSDMDEIIAVTESGNIDPVTLGIKNPPAFGDTLIIFPALPFPDEDDEIVVDTLTADNIYSEADNDYYIGGNVSLFIQNVIQNGIKYREKDSMPSYGDEYGDSSGGSSSNGGTGNSIPAISPMLKTNWSQTGLYDDECDNKAVGCSALALAMIIAYNEQPTTLKVNGTTILWNSINEVNQLTSTSSETAKIQIPLLIASIYHKCSKMYFRNRNETLITPRQIEKRMNSMQYLNVVRHKGADYNDNMYVATLQMLSGGKPVFISAIDGLLNGHSWVIDGCDVDNTLLHFNFGWGGTSNGYYTKNALNYELYDWHFRVITYDSPIGTNSVEINY